MLVSHTSLSAVPAPANNGDGRNKVLVEVECASDSELIFDLSAYSGLYSRFEIEVENVYNATSANLYVYASTDGGSTYLSSYSLQYGYPVHSPSYYYTQGGTSYSYILAGYFHNSTAPGNLKIEIAGAESSTERTSFSGGGSCYQQTGSVVGQYMFTGAVQNTNVVTHVKMNWSGGTFASGRVRLIGVV